jgi:multidrug efflux pump subunit AcrA (membrane-fusion protein)
LDPREIIQDSPRRTSKLIIGLLLSIGIVLAGFFGFREWFVDDGSVGSAPTFDKIVVERGDLGTTLTTSGTATARESAELNFGSSGVVETVEVALGDQINKGDVLATLDNRDAHNDLVVAKNNLIGAELKLAQLLEVPTEAALSESEKVIASAVSQLASAELNYETALDPPDQSEITSADATVTQRESEVVSANLQTESAYADLQVIQRAFCNVNQIQPEILIDDAETLWDEVDGRGVSLILDQATFVQGANSLKLELPRYKELESVIAQKTFEKLNLTGLDHVEFWVRSDVTIGNGYFELALYDSLPTLSPLEVFPIPALEGDVWTLITLPMLNLKSDTEIEGLGLRFSAGTAQVSSNQSLWIDEIKAIDLNQICSSVSLPLSDESIGFVSDTVNSSTSANGTVADIGRNFIKSNSSYVKSLDDRNVAAANLVSATAKRTKLDDPLSDSESAQLLAAIQSAQATLTSALAKKDDLLDGPSGNAIKLQELDVAKAKQSVDEARQALDDTVLLAPFSGEIGTVNISRGVWVTASSPVFSLVNLDSVGVDLTVSESDFVELSSGDLGMAVFDSIPDQPFLIKLVNITSFPQITQGVVTYPAQAEFLGIREAAEVLSRFGSMLQGTSDSFGAGSGPTIGPGIDIEALRKCAAEQIGREVSDPSQLTTSEIGLIRDKCLSGGGTRGGRGTGSTDSTETRVRPAVGMNATVTMLLETKEDVLMVPSQAIQSDNGREVVTVLSQETNISVVVSTGITNGDKTEIISGLEEGQVVLIPGASNTSVTTSSSSNRSTNMPGQRGAPR